MTTNTISDDRQDDGSVIGLLNVRGNPEAVLIDLAFLARMA